MFDPTFFHGCYKIFECQQCRSCFLGLSMITSQTTDLTADHTHKMVFLLWALQFLDLEDSIEET